MRRPLLLLALGSVGSVACASILGDFSIGGGSDAGTKSDGGGQIDGATSDAGDASDAGPTVPFCDGGHTFCADFDTVTIVSTNWASSPTTAGCTVALDMVDPKSPPNSFRATIGPNTTGGTAKLRQTFTHKPVLTWSFDVNVLSGCAAGPPAGTNFAEYQIATDYAFGIVAVKNDAGVAGITLNEFDPSNALTVIANGRHPLGGTLATTWFHVDVKTVLGATSSTTSIAIDEGTPLTFTITPSARAIAGLDPPAISMGAGVTDTVVSVDGCQLDIDNVAVDLTTK